jgi:two-component system sensor histidine kinase KdpD
MVQMLTHDIKVPLTSILGFAEFLAAPNGLTSPKAPDHLRKILGNAHKVIALLENYLTNARYEEGRLDVTRTPVSVRELAGDVARMLEPESVSKAIQIENRVPEELRASLDEHLMFRALANLVNNAVKYSPAGSAIAIDAEETTASGHPELALRVTNTGVALSPQECEAVFRRYQRGRTSRGTSGWGLGLHVVRCVAEAHGGHVTCTSDAACPSVSFTMLLPCV